MIASQFPTFAASSPDLIRGEVEGSGREVTKPVPASSCLLKPKGGVELRDLKMKAPMPFGRLWYGEPQAASNAIGYVDHTKLSLAFTMQPTMIETHEHKGDFNE